MLKPSFTRHLKCSTICLSFIFLITINLFSPSLCVGNLLLSHSVDITSKNIWKSTPTHIAASSGSADLWKLLTNAGADLSSQDLYGRTPEQVLRVFGWTLNGELISRVCPQSKPATAIITHPLCRQHYTCPPSETETMQAPPENKKRLEVIISEDSGALRSEDMSNSLIWIPECRAATISDVLRVHEWPYIRVLQSRVERLSNDPELVSGIGNLDGDTTVSRKTYEAALRAAGSLCQGVDMVLEGKVSNAFCAVRPPGHHAGPKGLVKGVPGGPDSHGFCFLNNLSIGAAYAMNVHREKIKKVALVDFDVHNGNGTAETVRWLKPIVDEEVMVNPYNFGSFSSPRYKPWYDENDSQNVMFISVHGYGPREPGLEHLMPAAAFYPGSGETSIPEVNLFQSYGNELLSEGTKTEEMTDLGEVVPTIDGSYHSIIDKPSNLEREDAGGSSDEDDEMSGGEESVSECPAPQDADSRLAELRSAFSLSAQNLESQLPPLILNVGVGLPDPNDPVGSYRHQWRNYFRNEIFPRLLKFKPDMIFISAGFDAHKRDEINGGYIALTEEDFEWVTNGLMRIANSCCSGRVVSSLEGGYQISGEHCSAFAKSVKFHVRAMAKAARCTAKYDLEEAKKEMEMEAQTIRDFEARSQTGKARGYSKAEFGRNGSIDKLIG